MKYIVAIIQPDKLDDVMSKLEGEKGEGRRSHLVTVAPTVMGARWGRQKGMFGTLYRSHKDTVPEASQEGQARIRRSTTTISRPPSTPSSPPPRAARSATARLRLST
jgi:hypothetical protein